MSGIFPWVQRHWDARAAANFIGGGTGTGLLMVSAFAAVIGNPASGFTLVGLLFVALGLFSVWLELGRPWRFINVLFHPRTSWMTREAIVAGPLFLFGLATAFTGWTSLALLTAAIAGGFLYCQGRILKAAKGIPAWRAPEIVGLIFATGLTEGAGAFLVIAAVLGAPKPAVITVALALIVLVVLRQIAWRRYLTALQGNAPKAALQVLGKLEALFLGIGLIAPIILVGGSLFIPGVSVVLGVLGGACATLGGWLFKFTLITRAAYNQGYAINHIATRGGDNTVTPGIKPGW